ncbi:MAG: hypothetical protein LBF04_00900 [Prevotellaceae bacterium]|jgi:hypothetical protein|nr:hypothetical protein [Prevotellaceae bacterium]
MKLEIKIKRPVNSKKIGTAAWTIEEMKKSVYELKTLENGRLAIVADDIIICKEHKDNDKDDLFYRKLFCYDNEKISAVWMHHKFKYAVAICAAEEFNSTNNYKALFGRVLTKAAHKIVTDFIKSCADLLLAEMIKRDETEEKQFENFKFQITEI